MGELVLSFMVPLAVLALFWGLGAFGPRGVRRQEVGDILLEAAARVGLERVKETAGELVGWAGPLRVRLSGYGPASGAARITLSGPGLPEGMTIRPEDLGTAVRTARGVREIETGDLAFDEAAWVEGSEAVARAVLDAGTRRALLALLQGRLERERLAPFWAITRLEEGVLCVDVPEVLSDGDLDGGRIRAGEAGPRRVGGIGRLGEILEGVLAFARRLDPPRDPARRIAENLRSEPEAGVRRQSLAFLVREFADHPATREALLAARGDADAEVRLRAGLALGPEGRDVLLAVAGDRAAEDETAERAVTGLGDSLTAGEAQGLLREALRTRRESTAHACVRALGRRGGAAVAMLAKVLALETPEIAAAAAQALGETGDGSAEAPLVEALGSPHEAVRVAAARALGRAGTASAVVALREAEAGDRSLRAAARQAIAEIQSRAKGALPGQLSLAEGGSGRLSLAAGENGRLSLSDVDGETAPSRTPEKLREQE